MIAHFAKSLRALTFGAAAYTVVTLTAVPAAAQTTYQYEGNPFTLFSCGLSPSGSGTLNCPNPAPGNINTSYLATDRVTATLVLAAPLPANLPLQDIRSFAGFSLTLDDGQHTVTDQDAVGMFAEVATGPSGEITLWRFVINTGGLLNGGISTTNSTTFDSDGGTLACCDPTVPGDLARVFDDPGTWTTTTPPSTPADAVADLILVVSSPGTGLTAGQVAGLTDKLDNALASINAGLQKQAINQLQAFINSVQSSAKNGKISVSTAQALIDAATAIIADL